jgi:hypothetical protein
MKLLDYFDVVEERVDKPSIVRPKPELIEGIEIGDLLYCRPEEVQVLAGFLKKITGDYIEIGVNQGGTARWLCKNNPGKKIYGVDLIDQSTMHPNQNVEQPTAKTVAQYCLGYENFKLILGNSRETEIPEGIEMAFIDADHQYNGVKRDTLNVLAQMNKGFIFWHDYNNDVHPDYLGVNSFIDNEIVPKLKVYLLEHTWLAMAEIE